MKGGFHARERPFCHFVRFVRTRQRREPHWPGGVFALACGYDPLARGCGRACPQAWHIGLWMWSCLPAGMAILACGCGHVDPRAWSRWSGGHGHIGPAGAVALTWWDARGLQLRRLTQGFATLEARAGLCDQRGPQRVSSLRQPVEASCLSGLAVMARSWAFAPLGCWMVFLSLGNGKVK